WLDATGRSSGRQSRRHFDAPASQTWFHNPHKRIRKWAYLLNSATLLLKQFYRTPPGGCRGSVTGAALLKPFLSRARKQLLRTDSGLRSDPAATRSARAVQNYNGLTASGP